MIRRFTLFTLFSFTLLSLLPSCQKFEGDQTVPSYIRIDSIRLSCDYYTYGANTSRFVDAWVYVDDDCIGCYELPATLPVLKEGVHRLEIRPGIKVNGIANTRTDYPFVAPATYSSANLVPDSVLRLAPVVNYWPQGPDENMHVRWMEDFDGGSITIQPHNSDANIVRVTGSQAWHDPEGIYSTYSGKVVLASDTAQFRIVTSEQFADLPTKGSACMLEMDYKCSDSISVGMYYKKNNVVHDYPFIRLKPTGTLGEEPGQWNKIYINVGPYLVENEGADYFQLYISSWDYRNDGTQYFYFDNLKLIYRDR